MTVITCERCGAEFDTDREPPSPGASTDRCPSCGKSHDAGEAAASDDSDGGDNPGSCAAGGVAVRITIEVHGANSVDVGTQGH